MPFSVPLPLGGFSSELGGLAERQRSLEAARVSGSSAVWAPSVTVPVVAATWQTVANWPAITIPACYIGGVFVTAGASITDLTSAAGGGLGVSVDGASPDLTNAVGIGQGDAGAPSTITIVWVIAPIPLANHTYSLQFWNDGGFGGGSVDLDNAFLTIDPF